MPRYRLRPRLIIEAIHAVKNDKKRTALIVLEPVTGISVDATFLILKKVEILRDRYPNRAMHELRGLVSEVAFSTGFPSGTQYAYVLVVMRYYTILSVFAAKRRRQFKERRKSLKKAS